MSVERTELRRIAGKMVGPLAYLEQAARLRRLEGGSTERLSEMITELRDGRERVIEIADTLPEGPLEAFAREHPMYHDDLDGPYCGYGSKEGKPYSCPVHDPVLHWDAWELMGTTRKRPERARRAT